jgi:hypothetical protein
MIHSGNDPFGLGCCRYRPLFRTARGQVAMSEIQARDGNHCMILKIPASFFPALAADA